MTYRVLIGNPSEVGIEIEVVDVIDGWALGSFLLWIRGASVGDSMDRSVHIQGCVNWLRDFAEHPRNRVEPGLFALPREEVYQLLSRMDELLPALSPGGKPIEKAFSRFHISHLGMSSFDQTTLLLIEDQRRRQRVIWQQRSNAIQEAFLPPGQLQRVAAECVEKVSAMLARP